MFRKETKKNNLKKLLTNEKQPVIINNRFNKKSKKKKQKKNIKNLKYVKP